jgi:GTPase SAR1 family protein
MRNILLIGACGVGKTWVMSNIVKDLNKRGKIGLFRFHYNDKVVVPGIYDGSMFQGSDKLSMAVTKDLDKFSKWAHNKIVIYEGDRFTNAKVLSQSPYVIKIAGDGSKGRSLRGSEQSERHLKSIATRVANIQEDVLVEDSVEALIRIRKMII